MNSKNEIINSIKGKIPFINDFSKNAFDKNKSELFSELSRLAYLAIPEHEFERRGRFKIIPCDIYYNISREDILKEDYLNKELETENSFIITTKSTVIIGIKSDKSLFICIRGTASLYESTTLHDLGISAACWLQYIGKDACIHKGYLEATLESVYPLSDKINELSNVENIYITGHSLGGAIGTILFNILSDSFLRYFLINHKSNICLHAEKMNSCYTFGMPRYGNIISTALFRPSYHTFHRNDIFTNLPPKFTGYADNLYNIEKTIEEFPDGFSEKNSLWENFKVLINPIKIKRRIHWHHKIENYCNHQ